MKKATEAFWKLANQSSFKVTIAPFDKKDEEPIVLKVTVGGDIEERVRLEIEFLSE